MRGEDHRQEMHGYCEIHLSANLDLRGTYSIKKSQGFKVSNGYFTERPDMLCSTAFSTNVCVLKRTAIARLLDFS